MKAGRPVQLPAQSPVTGHLHRSADKPVKIKYHKTLAFPTHSKRCKCLGKQMSHCLNQHWILCSDRKHVRCCRKFWLGNADLRNGNKINSGSRRNSVSNCTKESCIIFSKAISSLMQILARAHLIGRETHAIAC